MKNDLATSIIAAVVGVVAAYFICNFLLPAGDTVSFSTVDETVTADLATPNPEIFNYKALNPTVEVYIGNCTNRNQYGECVDESSEQIEEGIIVEEGTTEVNSESTSSTNSASNNTTTRGVQSGTSD